MMQYSLPICVILISRIKKDCVLLYNNIKIKVVLLKIPNYEGN